MSFHSYEPFSIKSENVDKANISIHKPLKDLKGMIIVHLRHMGEQLQGGRIIPLFYVLSYYGWVLPFGISEFFIFSGLTGRFFTES